MSSSIEISSAALNAARIKMDIIAQNIANSQSPDYKRKSAVIESFKTYDEISGESLSMPKVAEIKEVDTPQISKYDPYNPKADENGYVKVPAWNPVEDMAELMEISRIYEANLAAVEASKNMNQNALNIGR